MDLPPSSPELNPCEQLWDVVKDTEGFANALFDSIDKLRAGLLPGLLLRLGLRDRRRQHGAGGHRQRDGKRNRAGQ